MSPYAILAGLALLAGAAGAGWKACGTYRDGIEAAADLERSEAARQVELAASHKAIRMVDTYAQKLQADRSAAAAAVRDAGSVRHETDRLAARARAAGASAGAAEVSRVADLLAEGAELLAEGRSYLVECGAARESLTIDGGRLDR